MLEFIRQPWPWYISGPLLGLMVPLLLFITNKQFGVSSNFRHICAMYAPKSIKFFDYDWKKEAWNLVLIVGTIAGAWLAHTFLNPTVGVGDDTYAILNQQGVHDFDGFAPISIFSWEGLFTLRGFIMIVVGGFLVGFGTRYANGCTSGHAIMGLSMLNVNSLIAVVGFFIGGLTMTYLVLPYILEL
ncbi:YeeE/YedE thiosulfate transporter family protein [uncultured Cytophaga sp.]|uniref:YeeE/YedE family protein n=1 Tax=uncultured Cytophaga sp. TaxID=160238 RepID=UPI0026086D29|nr:YeeE/YedE thiosulfate transporter family protein [uncultured Cytophaga sp.]